MWRTYSCCLMYLLVLDMRTASTCNETMVVEDQDQVYYLYSPDYPLYTYKYECTFNVVAPSGNYITGNCSIDIPASDNCQHGGLLIWRTGNASLKHADHYCGKGNFELKSVSNAIVIQSNL